MSVQNLIVGGTNVVRLRGLRDEVDKIYLDDATVVGTLKDDANADVAGAVNLAMDYHAASGDNPAEYRATITHFVSLTLGNSYTFNVLAITANGSSRRPFKIPCLAVEG